MVKPVVFCFPLCAASLETWVHGYYYLQTPNLPLHPGRSTQLGNMTLSQCAAEADKTGTRWLTLVEGMCTIANPEEGWPFDDAADCPYGSELPVCDSTYQKATCCGFECCGAYGYPPNTMDMTCCHAAGKVLTEDQLHICPGTDLCHRCTDVNGEWVGSDGMQWTVYNVAGQPDSCGGYVRASFPHQAISYSVNEEVITRDDGITGTIGFGRSGRSPDMAGSISWSDGDVWTWQDDSHLSEWV